MSLRAVFPLAPGRYAIAPARLVYAMPLSYSFFSREESFELRSDSTVIIAIEPPAAGRPADYMGAVGLLRAEVRLDTTAARTGDAMHLTVRISGAGNVKLFPRPVLEIPWATAIQAGERVVLSPDSIVVRGVKEFDWVITPTDPGKHTLAAIRYPFFDPDRRRYDVAMTIPIGVTIAPGTLAAVDSNAVARGPVWELRPEFRGALAPPLYRRIPFMLLMALLPAPAIAFAIANRPRRERRKKVRIPPEQALRELVRRRDRGDLRPLRRAFLDAVAARLRAPASALAEPEALRHSARRAGTSGATAAAAATLVSELNAAAFAQQRSTVADPHDRALKLYRAIDAESRRWKVPARRLVIILTLGLAASAGVAKALEPDTDEARFTAGVAAYTDHHYADAAQDFTAVTDHEPRAADAWANLGTAAFAAATPALAVAGWQRALRLEPLAVDVRERLDLVAPAPASSPGAVPPVPPLPLDPGRVAPLGIQLDPDRGPHPREARRARGIDRAHRARRVDRPRRRRRLPRCAPLPARARRHAARCAAAHPPRARRRARVGGAPRRDGARRDEERPVDARARGPRPRRLGARRRPPAAHQRLISAARVR